MLKKLNPKARRNLRRVLDECGITTEEQLEAALIRLEGKVANGLVVVRVGTMPDGKGIWKIDKVH